VVKTFIDIEELVGAAIELESVRQAWRNSM